MAATAALISSETDMAAATAAPSASPAAALPAPLVPDRCLYKSLLHEWAHQNNQQGPVYHPEWEGEQHQLKFRSTVEVGGERFSSNHCHSRRKDAEQDAARVAYENLVINRIDDDHTDYLGLIEQDVRFCKSILSEFAVKTKSTQPSYSTDLLEILAHMPLYVSSVSLAGNLYTGEAARKKKDAEQKAARAAVISILATNNACMQQIIKSKKQQIISITSAGLNKERVVSQENCNAPTNAITAIAPITFVPAVVAACATADHVVNSIPAADPSDQAGSMKRKKHRTAERYVTHRNVRCYARLPLWSTKCCKKCGHRSKLRAKKRCMSKLGKDSN